MRDLPYIDPEAPRSPVRRAVLRLLSTRLMSAAERSLPFRLLVWRLTPRLMGMTNGRLAVLLPFPVALLETRDARNGRPHRRVVIYFHDDERVTVIPSKGGMPDDPFWYQNALADPDVRLDGGAYRAQVVTDQAAQARLWALGDRFYPAYATYRQQAARSGRRIPILQLIPVS